MRSKWLCLFTAALSACLIFAACNDDKPDPQGATETLIHSFESWEEARDYTYEGWFGKVETNTDPAYITEGKGSLKVYPYGDLDKDTSYPFISVNTDGLNVATNNFSSFKVISLDVFNPNDVPVKVRLSLYVTAQSVAMTVPRDYTLPAGEWSRLDYDLSDGGMRYAFDSLDQVNSVCIQFLNKRTKEEEVKPLYLDNLRGVNGECATYVPSSETFGFEQEGDVNALSYYNSEDYPFFSFVGEWNSDPKYVREGTHSLKLTLVQSSVDYNNYASVIFNQTMIRQIAFEHGLTFDIYSECEAMSTMEVIYSVGSTAPVTVTQKLGKGWNTFKMVNDISNATTLQIRFPNEFKESNYNLPKVYYIDNIRENVFYETEGAATRYQSSEGFDLDLLFAGVTLDGEPYTDYRVYDADDNEIAVEDGFVNLAAGERATVQLYRDGVPAYETITLAGVKGTGSGEAVLTDWTDATIFASGTRVTAENPDGEEEEMFKLAIEEGNPTKPEAALASYNESFTKIMFSVRFSDKFWRPGPDESDDGTDQSGPMGFRGVSTSIYDNLPVISAVYSGTNESVGTGNNNFGGFWIANRDVGSKWIDVTIDFSYCSKADTAGISVWFGNFHAPGHEITAQPAGTESYILLTDIVYLYDYEAPVFTAPEPESVGRYEFVPLSFPETEEPSECMKQIVAVAPDGSAQIVDGTLYTEQAGKYTIYYRAVDEAGNFNIQAVTLTVNDRSGIYVSEDWSKEEIYSGYEFTPIAAHAVDAAGNDMSSDVEWRILYDGDAVASSADGSSVTLENSGTHTIVYSCGDLEELRIDFEVKTFTFELIGGSLSDYLAPNEEFEILAATALGLNGETVIAPVPWTLKNAAGDTVAEGAAAEKVSLSAGEYTLEYRAEKTGFGTAVMTSEIHVAEPRKEGTLSWNETALAGSVAAEDGMGGAYLPVIEEIELDDVTGVELSVPVGNMAPVFRLRNDNAFAVDENTLITFKVRASDNFIATSGGLFISFTGASAAEANGGARLTDREGNVIAHIFINGADKANNGNQLVRDRAVYGENQGGYLLNTTSASKGWTTVVISFDGVENPSLEGLVIAYANRSWIVDEAYKATSMYISDFKVSTFTPTLQADAHDGRYFVGEEMAINPAFYETYTGAVVTEGVSCSVWFDNEKVAEGFAFTPEKVGEYTVKYTAVYCGVTMTAESSFTVETWQPTILTDGAIPASVRWEGAAGGKLAVPAAYAYGADGETVQWEDVAWALKADGGEEILAQGTGAGSYTFTAGGIYILTYMLEYQGAAVEKTFIIDAYAYNTAAGGTLSWNETTISGTLSVKDGKDKGASVSAAEGEYEGVHGMNFTVSAVAEDQVSSPVMTFLNSDKFALTQNSVVTFRIRVPDETLLRSDGGGVFITWDRAKDMTIQNADANIFAADGLGTIAADNPLYEGWETLGILVRSRAVDGAARHGLLLRGEGDDGTHGDARWVTVTVTFEGVEDPSLEGLMISFADENWKVAAVHVPITLFISDFTVTESGN